MITQKLLDNSVPTHIQCVYCMITCLRNRRPKIVSSSYVIRSSGIHIMTHNILKTSMRSCSRLHKFFRKYYYTIVSLLLTIFSFDVVPHMPLT